MATQFVHLKNRTINVAYIRHYQKAPDGSITVHLDREGVPFIVPADEAQTFLAVVEPNPEMKATDPKEKVPAK